MWLITVAVILNIPKRRFIIPNMYFWMFSNETYNLKVMDLNLIITDLWRLKGPEYLESGLPTYLTNAHLLPKLSTQEAGITPKYLPSGRISQIWSSLLTYLLRLSLRYFFYCVDEGFWIFFRDVSFCRFQRRGIILTFFYSPM